MKASTVLPANYGKATKSTADAMKMMQKDAQKIFDEKDKIIIELNQKIDELENQLNSKTLEHQRAQFGIQNEEKNLEIALQEIKEKRDIDLQNLALQQQRELKKTMKSQEIEISGLEEELKRAISSQQEIINKRVSYMNQDGMNQNKILNNKSSDSYMNEKIQQTKAELENFNSKKIILENELKKLLDKQRNIIAIKSKQMQEASASIETPSHLTADTTGNSSKQQKKNEKNKKTRRIKKVVSPEMQQKQHEELERNKLANEAKIADIVDSNQREIGALEEKLNGLVEDVEIIKRSLKKPKRHIQQSVSFSSGDISGSTSAYTKSSASVHGDQALLEAEIYRLTEENGELKDLLSKYDKIAYGEDQ